MSSPQARLWPWTIAAVACAMGFWLAFDSTEPPPADSQPAAHTAGRVAADGPGRYVLTARWGFPAGPARADSETPMATHRWRGELAVDCGAIVAVEPLGMELPPPALPTAATATAMTLTTMDAEQDRLSDVRQRADRASVDVRSTVGGDWDGLRAVVIGCGDGEGQIASTLSLRLGQRDFAVALVDDVDAFVVLPAGAGQALEVRVAAEPDPQAARGSRVVERVAPAEPVAAPTPFRRPEPMMALDDAP